MADTLGRARDRVAAFADELAKQDAVRMMTSRFARTIAADLRLLLATREPSEADVERVAAWGPPKLVAAGRQFGFVLVSPQCSKGDWWRVDDLEVLLKDVERRYAIDRSRVYLTGLSMGGCATWDWLLRDADTFAAAG